MTERWKKSGMQKGDKISQNIQWNAKVSIEKSFQTSWIESEKKIRIGDKFTDSKREEEEEWKKSVLERSKISVMSGREKRETSTSESTNRELIPGARNHITNHKARTQE